MDEYMDLAQKQKNLSDMKVTVIPIVVSAFEAVSKC